MRIVDRLGSIALGRTAFRKSNEERAFAPFDDSLSAVALPKLEIGAGEKPTEGYVHQDIRPLDDIEVVCDARSFPPWHVERYAEVYASNILEHFNRFEVEKVFAHWVSLLAPGGIIRIIVPDMKEICRQFVEGFIDARFFSYLCYGGNDYEYNKHFFGFDVACLTELMERNGLTIVKMKEGIPWEKRKKDVYCPMIEAHGRKD